MDNTEKIIKDLQKRLSELEFEVIRLNARINKLTIEKNTPKIFPIGDPFVFPPNF